MFRRIALTLIALCLPGLALAQGWVPERPVRIILPFPPGGSTDLVGRILADRVSRSAPHPWVVENRSGANGNIGMDAAAKSAPDGYTLGACTIGNCAINPAIYARMPYDIERDLIPVFWSGSVMNAVAVNNSVPAQTLQEFLAWVKTNPGRVNYGSSVMENIPTKVQAIRAGQIRALAVTGRERDPSLPDVPTFAEAGVPDIVVEPWFGFMAPRGTPDAVIAGLSRLLNEAVADPEVRRKFADLGVRPEGGPPERFAAHVRSEIARWREVVETNKIEKLN